MHRSRKYPKELRFRRVPGAVLAIKAHDHGDGGYREASFLLACVSTKAESPWNFGLSPDNAGHFARAFGLPKAGEGLWEG